VLPFAPVSLDIQLQKGTVSNGDDAGKSGEKTGVKA